MNAFLTILCMNIKLLLRNKGFIALLIILPVIAVLMLSLRDERITIKDDSNIIHELESDSERIATMIGNKLSVKVYDCSHSKLSDYILQELAETGSFLIYRYKSEAMDIDEARVRALNSANRNVIDAVIYIPATFEAELLNASESRTDIFEATKDGRIILLENNLNSYLQSLYHYAAVTGYNKYELIALLEASKQNKIVKKTVTIAVGDTLNLSKQQQNNSYSIASSLAFLTIAFLFSGVFIAATIVEERNNRVYNRILLSRFSLGYGLVKVALILMTVLLQTGIIAVAMFFLVKTNFGISYFSYLFLVFCLGLIFTLFSVVIGVLTNNVLTANYIAFLVWCLSCALAGVTVPLASASTMWLRIAMLMPQRWVVKTSEMLMVGKSDAIPIYIMVVFSYLFIIMSVGFLGIKIRKRD